MIVRPRPIDSIFAAFCCVLLVLVGCNAVGENSAAKSETYSVELGNPAPDFTLQTIDGKTASLSGLAEDGPVVLLVLRGYIGKQCPICNRQVGQYLSEAEAFADRGAKVVLIYPGPAEGLHGHAEDFISGKGLPDHFVFLLDPDMAFTDQYGLRWEGENKTAYPSTFVISKGDRVIRHTHISQSAGNRTTPSEVLTVLDRL